jgi:hypothetical protein
MTLATVSVQATGASSATAHGSIKSKNLPISLTVKRIATQILLIQIQDQTRDRVFIKDFVKLVLILTMISSNFR